MNGLYLGKVAVEGQSYQDRSQAYDQALAQVLVRVTGEQKVLANYNIKQALKQPTEYLVQYSFVQENEQLFLQAQFNEKLINQLVKDAGINLWGARRPLTLWWLAVENDKGRRIVSDSDKQIADSINSQAKLRGLPSILPIMDIEDQMLASVTDVWGRFAQALEPASERYQPEASVFARVYRQSGDAGSVLSQDWIVQLTLVDNRRKFDAEFIVADFEKVWQTMVDWVADTLAKQYAIKAQQFSASHINITIANVENTGQAVAIQKFLTTISAVDTALIQKVSDQGVEYQLQLLGEAIDVLEALALDNRVEKIVPIFADAENKNQNLYRWKGR
ncbi:hypothetical protein DS2_10162 [Catenovulum agarivorans DS-2]|uniref:DUF2066 domain-containing protein n=1 Tax=Catenovulum agarivorans DS-2 TaxID=1328313 RepID=W7QQ06_9ALTE|nr:hypothetical protein DS2_10162 [Catenovulum agarivorans DS-2]